MSGLQTPRVSVWDRIGTNVTEAKDFKEVLDISKLNWQVGLRPLALPDGRVVPERGVIRLDNEAYLGTVGPEYTPIQNESLGGFVEALKNVHGGLRMERCGMVQGGKRVFISFDMKTDRAIGDPKKGDIVKTMLELTNAHDGSSSFRARVVPYRLVCTNGLTRASEAAGSVVLRHFASVERRLDDAVEVIGKSIAGMAKTEVIYNRMAGFALSDEAAKAYIANVFEMPKVREDEVLTERRMERVEKTRGLVYNSFQEGVGSDLAGHTLWGAYNAVTDYVDHLQYDVRQFRQSATITPDERRYIISMDDDGAWHKTRAMKAGEALLATVGN